MSDLEETLAFQIRALSLPEPVREYRFHPGRKWALDFAWPALMLAAEVEGGTRNGGRHTRGEGFHKDCIKYNTATEEGWRLYRFDGELVKSGEAVALLERVILRAQL